MLTLNCCRLSNSYATAKWLSAGGKSRSDVPDGLCCKTGGVPEGTAVFLIIGARGRPFLFHAGAFLEAGSGGGIVRCEVSRAMPGVGLRNQPETSYCCSPTTFISCGDILDEAVSYPRPRFSLKTASAIASSVLRANLKNDLETGFSLTSPATYVPSSQDASQVLALDDSPASSRSPYRKSLPAVPFPSPEVKPCPKTVFVLTQPRLTTIFREVVDGCAPYSRRRTMLVSSLNGAFVLSLIGDRCDRGLRRLYTVCAKKNHAGFLSQ